MGVLGSAGWTGVSSIFFTSKDTWIPCAFASVVTPPINKMERIAKLDLAQIEVNNILGAKKLTHYRNKLEYTFSCQCWISEEQINRLNKKEKEIKELFEILKEKN